WMISSDAMLPLAFGAYGHPPSPPTELSKSTIPSSNPATALAKAIPLVLCKCNEKWNDGNFSFNVLTTSLMFTGVAMPVVSAKEISVMPSCSYRLQISMWRSIGTGPSYGQPNATEIDAPTFTSVVSARLTIASKSFIASNVFAFALFRLWESVADNINFTLSTFASIARSKPRKFGINARSVTPSGRLILFNTSSASFICGTAFGWTNDVTSTCLKPHSNMRLIMSTLTSVGTSPGNV